jgi:hypothetical protein
MVLNCVSVVQSSTPDVLVDTGTLTIDIDNTGLARLSVSITKKGSGSIVGDCSFSLGGNRTFQGYIVQDAPQELAGTGYIEHRLSALGTIKVGGGGGGARVA